MTSTFFVDFSLFRAQNTQTQTQQFYDESGDYMLYRSVLLFNRLFKSVLFQNFHSIRSTFFILFFYFLVTNEIPDDTINGQLISSIDVAYDASPNCLICEQVVKEVEKRVTNKKSRVS